MKKLLLATVALSTIASVAVAADLPYRRAAPAPAFVAVPVFTWTGFYVGVNAGYIDNEARTTTTGNDGTGLVSGTLFNTNADIRRNSLKQNSEGFTGGGQAGYNWQFGSVVMGIEADIAYTDLSSTVSVTGSRPAAAGFASSTYSTQMDYIGTVRGRVGYAMDRVLVYGTGGFAYGDVKNTQTFFAPGNPALLQFSGGRSEVQTGYAVGGGIEYAIPVQTFSLFNSAVTLKAEALYYDLGKQNVIVNGVIPATINTSYTSRTENTGVIARAGMNFKFNSF